MKTKKLVTAANNVICKVVGILTFAMCFTNMDAHITNMLGGIFSGSLYPINNHIIYEGKTKKKIPNGKGRIHCMATNYIKNRYNIYDLFKENGDMRLDIGTDHRQDLISGFFNGNFINDADAQFCGVDYSLWFYKGNMIIRLVGENVEYVLLPEGIIRWGGTNALLKDELTLTDTVVVKRDFTNFSLETPYIRFLTNTSFNLNITNQKYFEVPSAFFKKYVTYFELRYKDGWEYNCRSSFPGLKIDKSEQITFIVENCKTSKVIFGDNSWYHRYKDISGNPRVSFFAELKDGIIKTTADEKRNNLSHADIKFKNGDSYKGTIRIVTAKNGNHMADGCKYIIPSILDSDTYYFKNLSIKDNVIFVNGVYQDAGGLSKVYEGGYDDNERQEMEKEKAIAKANKEKAVKQANEEAARKRANKIAETKKLLPKLYGKTFSYNQYYDYYVAWSKHNGNASIKFSANRQDIFLRVGSTTTWLKLSEITNNGDLECIQAGSRNLADVCYITPYLDNGKISFIIDLLGGFKYRLSK